MLLICRHTGVVTVMPTCNKLARIQFCCGKMPSSTHLLRQMDVVDPPAQNRQNSPKGGHPFSPITVNGPEAAFFPTIIANMVDYAASDECSSCNCDTIVDIQLPIFRFKFPLTNCPQLVISTGKESDALCVKAPCLCALAAGLLQTHTSLHAYP